MKATDDAAPIVTPTRGLVMRGEDDIARTARGAEKGGHWQAEQTQVAQGRYLRWGVGPQALPHPRRITGVGVAQRQQRHRLNASGLIRHALWVYPPPHSSTDRMLPLRSPAPQPASYPGPR